MVLLGRLCGRVGRRRIYKIKAPSFEGAFFYIMSQAVGKNHIHIFGLIIMRTFLALICILISSCSSSDRILYIYNTAWPAGTIVSLINDSETLARTSMYGDRARLDATEDGIYTVRAASTNTLTYFSDELIIPPGRYSHSLITPRERRKINGKRYGIIEENTVQIEHMAELQKDGRIFVTTMGYAAPINFLEETGSSLMNTCHVIDCELIYTIFHERWRDQETDWEFWSDILGKLEAGGYDGLMVSHRIGRGSPGAIDRLALRTHQRGLSLHVVLDKYDADIIKMMFNQPAPECPDEVVIDLRPAQLGTQELIPPLPEELISSIMDSAYYAHIPLSRLSVVVTGSGIAYTPKDDFYTGAGVSQNRIDEITALVGEQSIFRMQDGTVRFGYGGKIYMAEDSESIRQKMNRLNMGPFKRSGGIYVSSYVETPPDSQFVISLTDALIE